MERALRTRFFALATFAAAGAAAAGASANAGFPVQRIAADGIAGIETGPTADVRENDAAVFRPRHLVDNLRWTPWCGTERGPQSVGGRIRFTFHSVRYVTQLEIVNGNIRSPKDLAEHVQTKAVLLRWDSGEQSFALARNQPEPQVLELPRPTPMRWLELEVREVYPGSGLGPCFTEIALMEPRDLLALQPAMLEEIQQLVGKLRQAEQAEQAAARLQEIGPPATPWIVSALKEKDAQLQVRVVRILAAIAEPSSGPVLEEAYRQSGDPELRQEILRAMAKVKSPSCVPFLVEQSHSKDTVVARLALLAMEGFGDDRTIQPFLQAVLYEEEPMARIAIRHLTGFGPRAYHALLPALGNPSLKVRERATWALGRIDSPAAREALLRQLQSGSMALAVAGLRGLGERNSEENFQIVSFNVQHEQPEIRIATAEALGGFAGNLEAVELLEKLAVDDQAEVRRQALASLSRMGSDASEALHRLARDGSGEKLEETLQTIAQLKDAPGIRLQIRLLADSRDAVQGRAKQMLDAQGTAGLDELVRAMADPDPRISFVAARRVSELGERGLPMLMRNATSSPDPIVRQACFKAIASIGLGAAREAVARGLTDPVAEVRREALQAASRIPAGEYASTIPQLLEQEPKETHLLAVEVAGQAQIGQAVPVLLRQIEAGHPNSVRILWALGRIGDQRALSVLAAKARSPESFTRQIAVTALGGLPGEQAMQVLMEAMLDPDPMVRMAAEKALSTPGR